MTPLHLTALALSLMEGRSIMRMLDYGEHPCVEPWMDTPERRAAERMRHDAELARRRLAAAERRAQKHREPCSASPERRAERHAQKVAAQRKKAARKRGRR